MAKNPVINRLKYVPLSFYLLFSSAASFRRIDARVAQFHDL